MGSASETRRARVASLVKRTLAELIAEELRDPRLGMLSLTGLELSKDLSYADVKVSTVGGLEASAQSVAALEASAGFLRKRLREETDLRIVPKLRFHTDLGIQYEDEIFRLIETLPPAADEAAEEE